jgi:hypothetical protein
MLRPCHHQDYKASRIGWLMDIEPLVKKKITGETEVDGENPRHCHVVHHKSHLTEDRTRAAAAVGSRRTTA